MTLLKRLNLGMLLLMLAMVLPMLMMAQKRGGGDRMEKMRTELNLSPEQVDEIKVINEEFKNKKLDLRTSSEEQGKGKKGGKGMREAHDQAILKVLNEEQSEQFLERKATQRKGPRTGDRHQGKTEEMKAAKTELKAYRKENIKPVLVTKRMEFENQLSPQEKKEIDDLRDAIKTKKQAPKNAFGPSEKSTKPKMEQGKKGKGKHGASTKGHHKGKGKSFENNPELKAKADLLVEKFASQLEDIENDLAPSKEQWKADQQAILVKHLDKEKLEKIDQKKASRKMDRRDYHSKIGFLLMRPEGPKGKVSKRKSQSTLHQLKAYPNPATNAQQLDFVVAEKGVVKVDLMDNSGKVVKKLFQKKLDAGNHSINVELPNLSGNNYYYLLSDKKGTSTLPIVLLK